MDSEIQFGQLEHALPTTAQRPDQDKHFAVIACGKISDNDLPIFVDLDAMRDMEAHARTNTSVELGGVMLGQQHIDRNGNPFVIVRDSLRARHYEATKGSFKFTHETWSQITLERKEFSDDLKMVGWYHTHPGWSVFLSGMDLFICDNFFKQPQDVALVIDPCSDDRGWFQWDGDPPKKRQTGGFLLMTNRHRRNELNYFCSLYDRNTEIGVDPRFARPTWSDSSLTGLASNQELMVDDMDSRRPVFDLAIVAMVMIQFMLAAILGWRLLEPLPVAKESEAGQAAFAQALQEFSDQLSREGRISELAAREQLLSETLNKALQGAPGQQMLADEYVQLKEQRQLMLNNQAGQEARIKVLEADKEILRDDLSSKTTEAKKSKEQVGILRGQLEVAREKVRNLEDNSDSTADSDQESAESSESGWGSYLMSLWPVWGGSLVLLLGIALGFFFAKQRFRRMEEEFLDRSSRSRSRPGSDGDADLGSDNPVQELTVNE